MARKEKRFMPETIFVGIDVAKFKHTCCALSQEGEVKIKPFDFQNDGEGYSSLLKKLGEIGPKQTVLIGMEATGHYHENLVRRLKAEGYSVRVFNPKLVAAYIKSERVDYPKTDSGDSLMIAEYLSKHPDKGSAGKSYTAEALASLSRELNSLIAERSRAYNRIQRHLDITFPELIGFLRKNADGSERNSTRGRNVLESPAVRLLLKKFPSAAKVAKMRDKDYEALRKASYGAFSTMRFARMKELAKASVGSPVESDEIMVGMLCEQADLLDSQIEAIQARVGEIFEEEPHEFVKIKGVGANYGAAILGAVGDFKDFPTADAVVQFAGLRSRVYESGEESKKGKMTKKGPPVMRYAAIQAAQKVILHYPKWAEYYRKKLDEGKFYKVALSHVAARLLKAIWKIEHDGLTFDPLKF